MVRPLYSIAGMNVTPKFELFFMIFFEQFFFQGGMIVKLKCIQLYILKDVSKSTYIF